MMMRVPDEVLESPSLSTSNGAGPAFELKFLLDEATAGQVEAWARKRLAPDPHGDPALDGAYMTTSVYTDTPQLDVYHRSPSYGKRKFRIRRYGALPWIFLERKSKSGDRVSKRRVAVPDEELSQLANPMSLLDWPGHWFHRRLVELRLAPACRIAYMRTAFMGSCAEGPLRLTFDRSVRGVPGAEWRPTPVEDGRLLLTDRVIMEFKFRTALPGPFKELIGDLHLTPGAVSKYRLCHQAWGAAPPREAASA